MIQKIQTQLQVRTGGLTTYALVEGMGMSPTAENQAMVDLFCLMAPGLRKEANEWKTTSESKTSKVLICLENFGQTSGKRIFRAEAALRGLPIEQHPTAEELREAIQLADGKFSLLPNQMIKFNG